MSDRANWYAAVRKKSQAGNWRLVFGPFKTKCEADAVHNRASMLISDMYPVEELYGVVHASLKVKPTFNAPGVFNHLMGSKP